MLDEKDMGLIRAHLQQHGKSEPETFRIVSESMWAALKPRKAFFQRLARLSFCLSLMKKVLPFGFRHGSGAGWQYTWRLDEDPKNRFHFECHECLYKHIFGKRNLMKLGAMFCHSDVIAFGSLPYADASFDIVLSLNGFHAFPDKEAAYRETYRVLKPGGTFCGCFYVQGGCRRTDWFIRNLYQPKGFFTPPYETEASLRKRLSGIYAKAAVFSVEGIAAFRCVK